MRVIVLGGAGDMGKRTVQALAANPEVTRLTVADLNVERAQELARTLGAPPRIRAVRVNALDPVDLVNVMREHDVAAGAIGPFYKFEVPLARAAIAAGVDYVSLCDDYDAAKAVLALDDEARAAGRRIITGMGWTPGLSNVLARAGVERLDKANAVDIAWCGASADSKGHAVVLHTLHIFTGKVPSFLDGRVADVAAGTGKVRLEFPKPLGAVSVYHVGHPEPVTLPLFIPGLRRVTLRGGLTEPFLNWLGFAIARLGLTNSVRKKDFIGSVVKKTLPFLERLGPAGPACSGLRVDVHGRRNGRPARITYAAADHMENLTGLPLAVGTLMLGHGRVRRLGVMPPEAAGAIDADTFLQELTGLGVRISVQDGTPAGANFRPAVFVPEEGDARV